MKECQRSGKVRNTGCDIGQWKEMNMRTKFQTVLPINLGDRGDDMGKGKTCKSRSLTSSLKFQQSRSYSGNGNLKLQRSYYRSLLN